MESINIAWMQVGWMQLGSKQTHQKATVHIGGFTCTVEDILCMIYPLPPMR